MRKVVFIIAMVLSVAGMAGEKVSFEELSQNWNQYKGRQVQVTTPLYVVGVYYDSLVLAPERLFVPEEKAVGLADGDSTIYYEIARANRTKRIALQAKFSGYEIRTGAVVRGLKARVTGEGKMLTGATPHFKNPPLSAKVPRMEKGNVTICSANIQNFFYHLGGYAQKKTTRGQFALQQLKVASALCKMNADLYTLCELEKGSTAPMVLVEQMNRLARKPIYEYVRTCEIDGDTISVGFVYRKDKIQPYGPLTKVYTDSTSIYANRFMIQGFKINANENANVNDDDNDNDNADGNGRFVVSLNHLRSKRGSQEESLRKRMNNVEQILTALEEVQAADVYGDEDFLLLGDYNSYTQEAPIQAFVRAGYADLNPAEDYTYVYDAEMGSLDRVFASPSMAAQVVDVRPVHWNADVNYTYGFKSKYNYKNRVIPVESPDDIRKLLSKQGRRNLLYRYADHDPVLVVLRLK